MSSSSYADDYAYCDPADDGSANEKRLFALIPVTLSILGGLILIFLYIKHRYLRNFAFLLVIHITVSDLLYCFAHFMEINDLEDNFDLEDQSTVSIQCYIQAAIIQFGGLSSIFWTGMVAFTLYSTVVLNYREIQRNYVRFCLWSYGFPAITTIV